MKKSLLLIFAAFLLLSACTPSFQGLSGKQVSPSVTLTSTATIEPTATFTPSPTHTFTPTPTSIGGGAGKLLFTYYSDGFKEMFPDLEGTKHVFMANLDGSDMRVMSEGLGFLNFVRSISPDGSRLLIASFYESSPDILYVINLNKNPSKPVEAVYDYTHPTKYSPSEWIDNDYLYYHGKGPEGLGFYVVKWDGTESRRINTSSTTFESLLSVNDERLYWYKKVHKSYGIRSGDYRAVSWTNLDGSGEGKLESNGVQLEYYLNAADFSPDGKKVAWIPSAPEPECDTMEKIKNFDRENEDFAATCYKLYVADLADMDNPLVIPLSIINGNRPEGFEYISTSYNVTWSTNNHQLYLQSTGAFFSPKLMFSIDLDSEEPELVWLSNFPALDESSEAYRRAPNGLTGFSPDGRIGLLDIVTWEDKNETVLLDLDTMRILDPILAELNWDGIDSLRWLP